MMYKPYYSIVLLLSSLFYYVFAMLDFVITMYGYFYYNDLFFNMEINPVICSFLKLGIFPVYMFIIPIIVLILSYRFYMKTYKINVDYKFSDRVIWCLGFSNCLVIMMGVLHLLGFISWFYHGGF